MRIVERHPSTDGITTKYVLQSADDLVECTHVNRPEKHIICFSTAVGCPISCLFCCAASFQRRLDADEMVTQCLAVLSATSERSITKRILFSAMGEGEPLLSLAAAAELCKAAKRLMNNVRNAGFAVSTSGVKPEVIRWLAHNVPRAGVKLQVSVHGATDPQRAKLVPVAAPITEVVRAAMYYEQHHPGKVEWNYVLVDGINDSESDSVELAGLLGSGRKVKLNRLNPIPHRDLRPSARSADFGRDLERHGLRVEYYATDGVDVSAACGQLRSRSRLGESHSRSDQRMPDHLHND